MIISRVVDGSVHAASPCDHALPCHSGGFLRSRAFADRDPGRKRERRDRPDDRAGGQSGRRTGERRVPATRRRADPRRADRMVERGLRRHLRPAAVEGAARERRLATLSELDRRERRHELGDARPHDARAVPRPASGRVTRRRGVSNGDAPRSRPDRGYQCGARGRRAPPAAAAGGRGSRSRGAAPDGASRGARMECTPVAAARRHGTS